MSMLTRTLLTTIAIATKHLYIIYLVNDEIEL